MNSKERVFRTLDRKPVDRTPLDCWLYEKYFVDMLEAEYGTREQFLDEFNIDYFTGFMTPPHMIVDGPLDIDDLADLDFGDPKDPKWTQNTSWDHNMKGVNIVEAVEQQGDKRAILAHLWGIIEGTSMTIGIENCWLHLSASEEQITAWFDRYADWLCKLVEHIKDLGAEMITLSDDWGSNQTTLFDPEMWRRVVKPYAKRVVQHARSIGLYVNLHSDGFIMPLMDDIIEIGYHSMHPVQESAGMDPATVKKAYGDKISFYGSLDVIDGILTHDGDELDQYIEDRFNIYAPGGGYIFHSAHFIQPDIPPKRLLRAYQKANEMALRFTGAEETA